jgi:two-component system, cell cycle response regulator DivK
MGNHAKHILIVDDFKDDREMYGQFLLRKGYEVTLACDGQEALDKAFQLRPDIIVMDLYLPVIPGWEAIRKLKSDERTKHIPILVLTARALTVAASLACEGCLIKPCLPDDLLGEIWRILEIVGRRDAVSTSSPGEQPTSARLQNL